MFLLLVVIFFHLFHACVTLVTINHSCQKAWPWSKASNKLSSEIWPSVPSTNSRFMEEILVGKLICKKCFPWQQNWDLNDFAAGHVSFHGGVICNRCCSWWNKTGTLVILKESFRFFWDGFHVCTGERGPQVCQFAKLLRTSKAWLFQLEGFDQIQQAGKENGKITSLFTIYNSAYTCQKKP